VTVTVDRGGGETEPSGTYEAYRSALAAGAEYVEFDVRRTLDGTLVAFHRARLGWARPGWGRAVAAVSYARLCDLAGYEVPRMAELMQLLAGQLDFVRHARSRRKGRIPGFFDPST